MNVVLDVILNKLFIFVSLQFQIKLCHWAGGIDSKQVRLPSTLVGKTNFLLRFVAWSLLGWVWVFFSCSWVQQSY